VAFRYSGTQMSSRLGFAKINDADALCSWGSHYTTLHPCIGLIEN